jgi:pSer/pThr/pTyr-binding forkhead associated (FHA) protein
VELVDLVRQTRAEGPGGITRAGSPYLLEEGRLRTDTRRVARDATRRVSTEHRDDEAEVTGDLAHRRVYLVAPKGGRKTVTVGRSDECDVMIDLGSVSTKHASIRRNAGGDWSLRDLGSTNGTFLEGERLERNKQVPLPSGSVVRFGPEVKLTFLHADAMEAFLRQLDPVMRAKKIASSGKTGVVLRKSDVLPQGVPLPAYLDDTPTPSKIKLPKLTSLALACPPFSPIGLVEGVPVVVGRVAGNDLILPHPEVSRSHARFERAGDSVAFTDLKSANGVYQGEKQVSVGTLAVGDEVTIGPYRISIVAIEAPPPRGGSST